MLKWRFCHLFLCNNKYSREWLYRECCFERARVKSMGPPATRHRAQIVGNTWRMKKITKYTRYNTYVQRTRTHTQGEKERRRLAISNDRQAKAEITHKVAHIYFDLFDCRKNTKSKLTLHRQHIGCVLRLLLLLFFFFFCMLILFLPWADSFQFPFGSVVCVRMAEGCLLNCFIICHLEINVPKCLCYHSAAYSTREQYKGIPHTYIYINKCWLS